VALRISPTSCTDRISFSAVPDISARCASSAARRVAARNGAELTTERLPPTINGLSPIRSGFAAVTASAILPATYSDTPGCSRLAAT
jgi:hypothetical protein